MKLYIVFIKGLGFVKFFSRKYSKFSSYRDLGPSRPKVEVILCRYLADLADPSGRAV
jgi:hypothetical protein